MPPELPRGSAHAQRHFLGFETVPYATILSTDHERCTPLSVELFAQGAGKQGECLLTMSLSFMCTRCAVVIEVESYGSGFPDVES